VLFIYYLDLSNQQCPATPHIWTPQEGKMLCLLSLSIIMKVTADHNSQRKELWSLEKFYFVIRVQHCWQQAKKKTVI